jgi:hypothetical protein
MVRFVKLSNNHGAVWIDFDRVESVASVKYERQGSGQLGAEITLYSGSCEWVKETIDEVEVMARLVPLRLPS